MRESVSSEDFGPSSYNFDFDFDLKLTVSDYGLMLLYALFVFPLVVFRDLFVRSFQNFAGKRKYAVDDRKESRLRWQS